MYDVAVVTAPPAHLSVEARLTVGAAGPVALLAPPSARPAGTEVQGLIATDDRGAPLGLEQRGDTSVVAARPGAVRFRYRLAFQDNVPLSSTGSGLAATQLFAVTRSVFVAPDPAGYALSGRAYPLVWVHVAAPAGWQVVTGWGVGDQVFVPAGPDDLLGSTLAAAPDYRVYRDTAGGASVVLAIRGPRHFTDSTLERVVAASLRAAAGALGPVPAPRVTYTADLGWKGRTSGSLQGRASVALLWEPGELLERPRIHDIYHETVHLWFGGALQTARWWMEGVTDYLAARLEAESSGRPEDLADLCLESLRDYLQITRDTTMTMDEEQRENPLGDNTTLLVYRKGMLTGLLLDAFIRRQTDGEASLDDVARRMLALAAGRSTRRIAESEIRDVAMAIGGRSVAGLWGRVVEGESLLSRDEVVSALRTVTALEVPAPALNAKERKVLIGHPKP